MLTVFIQEVVLDVLAEESLYCLTDLLLLLQNVLVILRVVPLGDSWERGEAAREWVQLLLNAIIASKLARRRACEISLIARSHHNSTGFRSASDTLGSLGPVHIYVALRRWNAASEKPHQRLKTAHNNTGYGHKYNDKRMKEV